LGDEAAGFFGEGGEFRGAGSGSDDGDDLLHVCCWRMLWGVGWGQRKCVFGVGGW
jgi:hypothetical protein